jgi:hypothetical protein
MRGGRAGTGGGGDGEAYCRERDEPGRGVGVLRCVPCGGMGVSDRELAIGVYEREDAGGCTDAERVWPLPLAKRETAERAVGA